MGIKKTFGPVAPTPRDPSTVSSGVKGGRLDAQVLPVISGADEALQKSIADHVALDITRFAAVSGVAATRHAMLATPAAPSSWDLDPKLWTNPDIAANGWTIRVRGTPHTILTRAGNVELSTQPAAGTYRTSLLGGQLLIQVPVNTGFLLAKQTAVDDSYTYRSRMVCSRLISESSCWMFVGGSDRMLDTADFMVCGTESTSGGVQSLARMNGGTFTVHLSAAIAGWGQDNIRYLHQLYLSGSANVASFEAFLTESGGVLTALTATQAFTVPQGQPAYAGVAGHATPARAVFFLDHIRRLPQGTHF